jgi:hypothetical protein
MNELKKMKPVAWAIIIITLAVSAFFMNSLRRNARMETNLDEYMP